MNLTVRIIDLILAMLFFAFAWFQRNDIDPQIYHNPSSIDALLWLIFYLIIGVMLLIVGWRKIPLWILIISMLACVVQMVLSGPGLVENLIGDQNFTITGESMTAEDPRVELSREFFGALIALLVVIWISLQHRKL